MHLLGEEAIAPALLRIATNLTYRALSYLVSLPLDAHHSITYPSHQKAHNNHYLDEEILSIHCLDVRRRYESLVHEGAID